MPDSGRLRQSGPVYRPRFDAIGPDWCTVGLSDDLRVFHGLAAPDREEHRGTAAASVLIAA